MADSGAASASAASRPGREEPRRLRVAVLMGGASPERAVSLASGCEAARALADAGHRVTCVDTRSGVVSAAEQRRILAGGIGRADEATDSEPPRAVAADLERGTPRRGWIDARVIARERAVRRSDVAFLALHGGAGEDGTVQSLLDVLGVPYGGAGPVGCALAMDKDLSKRLMRDAGVRTPPWRAGPTAGEAVVDALGAKVVVKPTSGGSSVRLELVRGAAEIDAAAERVAAGGDRALFEAYVEGREYTVGVLDGEALPVVGIEPARKLFDYACKYEAGMAVERAPAAIPESLARTLRERALAVHRLLRLRHFSRVDFIVDDAGRVWCLEANALPGLTANSLLPKAARAAGIELGSLCERICRLGMETGSRRPWASRAALAAAGAPGAASGLGRWEGRAGEESGP